MKSMRLYRWHRIGMLLFALLAYSGVAVANPAQFEQRIGIKLFTADDGLPQSGVNAITQGRSGYLWIGSFGGLARFDGTQFSTVRFQRSQLKKGYRDSPSSNRILSLLEDDRGRLWIGTEDAGLNVLDGDGFRHLPACEGSCQVDALLQGKDRTVWAATKAGLLMLDPDNGSELWVERSSPSGYRRLAADAAGTVFVGGHDGLYRVSARRLIPVPLPPSSGGVRVLERDGDGLLVGTERQLYHYDPAGQRWQPMGVEEPLSAVRDAGGWWWVTQFSRRVMRQDAAGQWQDVPELSSAGANTLARDSEGNLWVSSGLNGLARVRMPMFALVTERVLGTRMAGRAIVDDEAGGLWLGSACGGLFHWRTEGTVEPVESKPVLGNACITSLLRSRDGALWVGTAEGTLGRMKDGRLERVETWPSRESVNVWQWNDGALLVGIGGSTLAMHVDASGRIVQRQQLSLLQGMRVVGMQESRRGGHWFIGDRGVVRLMSGRLVERWGPEQGLASRFARAVYEAPDGSLWIGTYGGGLARVRNGSIQHYDADNGLLENSISCIVADARGRLWLGGNGGVTLLPSPLAAGESIESIRFAAGDGLVPAEINGGASVACHRDRGGRLWFSLVAGFGVLDPAQVYGALAMPLSPHIEHVAVNGRELDAATRELRLPPFSRNLEIQYTAINLGRPQETQFRFRLSGVDDDWVETGSSRSIVYPAVPWGVREFEVQARVTGSPWSDKTARLRIIHPQPWYQRPWLWTLVTLLGLGVLVLSSREEGDAEVSPERL